MQAIQQYWVVDLMTSSYSEPSFLKDIYSLEDYLEKVNGGVKNLTNTMYIVDDIEDWPKEVILKRLQLRSKAMVYVYAAVESSQVDKFIQLWKENYNEKKV